MRVVVDLRPQGFTSFSFFLPNLSSKVVYRVGVRLFAESTELQQLPLPKRVEKLLNPSGAGAFNLPDSAVAC